jgi:exportin-5
VDAQATVVEAALKGFTKWRARSSSEDQGRVRVPNSNDLPRLIPSQKQEAAALEQSLESWAERLLVMELEVSIFER